MILGLNGSGKSTLINILSGVVTPTHGYGFILGYSVTEDLQKLQRIIGVCAQNDFLYPNLTAIEHLQLYSKFRSISSSFAKQQIAEKLDFFGLGGNDNKRAINFSGGIRRRLSVALATIGDPPVILLDEPTAAMDPLVRWRVWEMINQLKRNHVVIVTTHMMNEAEAIADQVAILADGHLRVFGTPMYLKSICK